jgi:hypothetical protein
MRKVHVRVTEEDIRQGARRSNTSCPVALAVKREFPKDSTIIVRSIVISVFTLSTSPAEPLSLEEWNARIPEIAQEFIGRFDSKQPTTPIAFDLELSNA